MNGTEALQRLINGEMVISHVKIINKLENGFLLYKKSYDIELGWLESHISLNDFMSYTYELYEEPKKWHEQIPFKPIFCWANNDKSKPLLVTRRLSCFVGGSYVYDKDDLTPLTEEEVKQFIFKGDGN